MAVSKNLEIRTQALSPLDFSVMFDPAKLGVHNDVLQMDSENLNY